MDLRTVKGNELQDRRSMSADAKAALLEAYKAAKAAAEPDREAKQAERLELAAERDARRAEREQAKLAEKARVEAETIEREAAIASALRAEADARDLADKNRIARVIADEAERKAERDRRYADRKTRQAQSR